MPDKAHAKVNIRLMLKEDLEGVNKVYKRIYPEMIPYSEKDLGVALDIFPEGQFVALNDSGEIVGFSTALIVRWDDYDFETSWRDFTDAGRFTNHDPQSGRTLYAADMQVDPAYQGQGIGRALYEESRFGLAQKLGMKRVRAGARLAGYHRYCDQLNPQEYVSKVVIGEINDPTLSAQLKLGFKVIGVTTGYFAHDPYSLGNAAIIEWINEEV